MLISADDKSKKEMKANLCFRKQSKQLRISIDKFLLILLWKSPINTTLYVTALYFSTLYFTTLYVTALYFSTLYFTTLYSTHSPTANPIDVSNTNVMTKVMTMTRQSFLLCLNASQMSEKLTRLFRAIMITAARAA